ncbi:MAG: STAS domain-containing protein [Burkholderiales bacterium]
MISLFNKKPAPQPRKGRVAVEHGFSGGAKPQPKGKDPAGAGAQDDPVQAEIAANRAAGVTSVMMMDVQEARFDAAPALEEAAILYANRQDDAARAALEEALAQDDLPVPVVRQAFAMLFDLFENSGNRNDFESTALAFAVRLETSPPAFNDRSNIKQEAVRAGNLPQVAFGAKLDAEAVRQCDQARAFAAKNPALRLDASKIESVTPEGADHLHALIAGLKRSARIIEFGGAAHLTALLGSLTETGRADVPQPYWLLMLDLLQLQGMQAEYEETALNYCVTYEVSPPAWVDAPKPKTGRASGAPTPTVPLPDDAFYLSGEIEGSAQATVKAIGDYAAEKTLLVIDTFNVKRLDFIAAGALLNLVSALKGTDRQIEIRNPSPLIAALLVAMGFTECARLSRRKESKPQP